MQSNPPPPVKLFNRNPIRIRLWLVAIGRIPPPDELMRAACYVARGMRAERS